MEDKRLNELENHPVGALMWRYFWPAFIGVMANSLYNILNTPEAGDRAYSHAVYSPPIFWTHWRLDIFTGCRYSFWCCLRRSYNQGMAEIEEILSNTDRRIIFHGFSVC